MKYQASLNGPAEELLTSFETNASEAFARLKIAPHRAVAFSGEFSTKRLGDVVVSRMAVSPYQVTRTPDLVSSSDADMVKVQIQHRGRALIEQKDSRDLVGSNQMVVYETCSPYRLRFNTSNVSTVIGIPRMKLDRYGDLLRRRTASAIPVFTPLSRTVSALFTDSRIDGMLGLETAADSLGDALTSLVVAALADVPAENIETESSFATRILAYCEANLSDPDLCPDRVARAHGISVRQLYKVLAEQSIRLSGWIRRRRLELIRDDLSDPANADLSVTEIANGWGVVDTAHLARALRAEFGLTPTEIRTTAMEEKSRYE